MVKFQGEIDRFRQMYIDTMTMVPERYGIYNINKKQKMKEIKMFYIITSTFFICKTLYYNLSVMNCFYDLYINNVHEIFCPKS
jgi:hypothetical protein